MSTNKKNKRKKNNNYKNAKSIKSNKNTKRQMEKEQKTDYNIPTISFKSGLILIVSSLVSTVVFPFLLSIFGIDNRLGVVVGNSLITSFAVAYTRYFVETKRGFSLGFFRLYILFALSFAIIGYFWIYKGIHI
ncbi:membrane protein [Clostridioides difficile]|nr:membrane protein [Clostridioides difficile]